MRRWQKHNLFRNVHNPKILQLQSFSSNEERKLITVNADKVILLTQRESGEGWSKYWGVTQEKRISRTHRTEARLIHKHQMRRMGFESLLLRVQGWENRAAVWAAFTMMHSQPPSYTPSSASFRPRHSHFSFFFFFLPY